MTTSRPTPDAAEPRTEAGKRLLALLHAEVPIITTLNQDRRDILAIEAEAMALAATEQAAEPREQVAWLIERGQPERQVPTVWWVDRLRWGIVHEDEWTDDAFKAFRFATREEAEQAIEQRSGIRPQERFGRAVEHVFVEVEPRGSEELRAALRLLNSMVESGERHTEQSRAVVARALASAVRSVACIELGWHETCEGSVTTPGGDVACACDCHPEPSGEERRLREALLRLERLLNEEHDRYHVAGQELNWHRCTRIHDGLEAARALLEADAPAETEEREPAPPYPVRDEWHDAADAPAETDHE